MTDAKGGKKRKGAKAVKKEAEPVEPPGGSRDPGAEKAPAPAGERPAEGTAPAPGALEAERDSYKERLQRVTADFHNYQKRVRREMEETRKYAAGPVILDLLGVLDDLQRAVAAAEGEVDDRFLHGFRMIADRFAEVLAKHGVTPVEAEGRPFDPNLHDALMEVEDPERPDMTVVEEFVRGYRLHDRLLRPARVKVSRNRSGGEEVPAPGEAGEAAGARPPLEDDEKG